MKKVYLCAPFHVDEDLQQIKTYTHYALRCGTAPVVPHFYALCLDDEITKERCVAAGRSLLWFCDELWVFGDEITEAMRTEIEFCRNLNIRIRTISDDEIESKLGGYCL